MKRFFLFLSFFLCLSLFLFFVFSTSKEDEEKLNVLLNTSSGQEPTLLNVKQERKNSDKEIWQREGNERKMIKVQSPKSRVVVREENGNFSLIEELSSADCWMQEKLYHDGKNEMQEIRRIKAQDAIFSYDELSFTAKHVGISRFSAKGHSLPSSERAMTLLMKGKAQAASFKLQDDGFRFDADHLKATFYPKGDQ